MDARRWPLPELRGPAERRGPLILAAVARGLRVTAIRVAVQADSPGYPEVEGEARVSSVVSGTACPTLQFKIREHTITLTVSTGFTGGVCGDIAAGKKLA
jgi:hypothetical protein